MSGQGRKGESRADGCRGEGFLPPPGREYAEHVGGGKAKSNTNLITPEGEGGGG